MTSSLIRIEATHGAVADIEASLLVNGVGPWPGFAEAVDKEEQPPDRLVVIPPDLDRGRPELPPLEGIARHVVEMLERKRQVILYGPPGTGKTYHAERIALEVVARHNFNCLPSQLADRQRDVVYGRGNPDPYIATCTFHPMYSYEDFIEGYRPDGEGFKLEPGIFKRMVTVAQAQPGKRFVLRLTDADRSLIGELEGRASLRFTELRSLVDDLDRRSSHYRTALTLVALIHQGARLGEHAPDGELPLSSFLLNMNLVFERFLGRYLSEHAPDDIRISTQEVRGDVFNYLDNASGWNRPTIRPDFVFRRHQNTIALGDAKYKNRYAHPPSAAELYQLTSYGLVYAMPEPREVLLLHPLTNGELERATTLLFTPAAVAQLNAVLARAIENLVIQAVSGREESLVLMVDLGDADFVRVRPVSEHGSPPMRIRETGLGGRPPGHAVPRSTDRRSGVQHRHGLFVLGVGHEGNAGDLRGLAIGGHQVLAGELIDGKLARAGHELLESAGEFVRVAIHGDRAEGDLRHLRVTDFPAHRLPAREDRLRGLADGLDRRGQMIPVAGHGGAALRPQYAFDVAAQEARNHRRPTHADQLRKRGTQRQGLEQMVLTRHAPGERDVRHRDAALGQNEEGGIGRQSLASGARPGTDMHRHCPSNALVTSRTVGAFDAVASTLFGAIKRLIGTPDQSVERFVLSAFGDADARRDAQ